MSNRLSIVLTAFLLLLLAIGYGLWRGWGPGREEGFTVRIARTNHAFVVPFMVADRDGLWAQMGVDVETHEFVAGRLCLDALLGGSVDLATVADVPIVNATLQGHKLEILATFVTSHRHVRCIGREDREIRTAADLRNKKIAVFLGTTMEYGMMKFLQETGVTLSEIEVANVRPPDIVVALLRGDVDAAFNWEPFLSEMKLGLGGQAFVCPPSETYRATFSLLARPGFAATHPEEVRKILRTLRVAIDQISDNRDDTVNLVAEELNLERETVDGFLDDYRYGLSLDEALLRLLEEEALWVIEANGALLQEVPDFEPLFNVAPLKAVQPDAVTMTQAER